MNRNASKTLDSKSSFGLSAHPGKTLTDPTEVRGIYTVVSEEPFEKSCRRDGREEVPIDPLMGTTFGNRHQGLAQSLGFTNQVGGLHRLGSGGATDLSQNLLETFLDLVGAYAGVDGAVDGCEHFAPDCVVSSRGRADAIVQQTVAETLQSLEGGLEMGGIVEGFPINHSM